MVFDTIVNFSVEYLNEVWVFCYRKQILCETFNFVLMKLVKFWEFDFHEILGTQMWRHACVLSF